MCVCVLFSAILGWLAPNLPVNRFHLGLLANLIEVHLKTTSSSLTSMTHNASQHVGFRFYFPTTFQNIFLSVHHPKAHVLLSMNRLIK